MLMPVIIRKVEFPAHAQFQSYEDWQRWYLDLNAGQLLPNTEIWVGKNLAMKINSLGCKGEEIDPSLPTAAFFGCSTTFGVGSICDSWPQRVRLDGAQLLNCGVEGWNMQKCLNWYQQIQKKVNLSAVVVYVGWHNLVYNRHDEQYWNAILSQFRGPHLTAFCSIATSLIDECRTKGVTSLLRAHPNSKTHLNYFEDNGRSLEQDYFNFWGDMEPKLEYIAAILDQIRRYNDFLKNFCQAHGHVFIDFESLLKPASYEHIPDEFFDVCHFRPGIYPKIADFVSQTLQEPYRQYCLAHPRAPAQGVVVPANQKLEFDDLRKNVYPLW
jgi:hypothetical protein